MPEIVEHTLHLVGIPPAFECDHQLILLVALDVE